ncbi:hypothetical protein HG535_0H03610 [Zygotorulaspora mrakii]|uniref:ATP synthase mitochondrial F1 complex assembly factor 2 n=1 Tax=Zygotorulaspora mrakii TaxID=42260 RepID=A0A7H9B9Q2_ZYGMR|nr:uncharacterized protein HG535_0H03610 [Zygotorulaspora mrakii]QLG75034.1 hypothetical protein HG535_0H03610 [Zygotorulaspora mrakii]
MPQMHRFFSGSINSIKTGIIQHRCYVIPRSSYAPTLGGDSTIENNLKTETNRLSKTSQKFWKQVSIKEDGSKLLMQLDSKSILTPLGNPIVIDKDRRLLAMLLQKEWETLPNKSIKPHLLPLTSLVSRCIDLESVHGENGDPDLMAKIGGDREKIATDLLRYLDTDTLLIFSPHYEYEGALREAQNNLYLPLISTVEQFLKRYTPSEVNLRVLDSDTDGLRGNSQAASTREAAKKFLDSLSLWDLAVFENTVLTSKSFICGILMLQSKASLKPSRHLELNTEEIVRAATLEIIHQVERWGEVEDTHDVDKRDVRRKLHAAGIVAFRERG